MKLRLPSILKDTQRTHHQFVLVQSSACASSLPLLREIAAARSNGKGKLVILCTLFEPAVFLDRVGNDDTIVDWSANIPGYSGDINTAENRLKCIEEILKSGVF